MARLIVDHSVSVGKIEKNKLLKCTSYDFTMWLHLKPSERLMVSVDEVWWMMLTEVSSDDGAIVHPTSSQTLTQSGNGLISSSSEETLEILRKMTIEKKLCALA